LVIEDSAHMRRILRTLLHGFGAREVYEADDSVPASKPSPISCPTSSSPIG
jgi:hypothetical protein